MQLFKHVAAVQCKRNRAVSGQRVHLLLKHQNEKMCDLYDFDHGKIVSTKWAGLSIFFLETADLLTISHTAVFRVYTKLCKKKKKKTVSEWLFCG